MGQINRLILEPELEDKLYALIKDGNYATTACAAVGISAAQYNGWIKRGEGRDRGKPATPEYVAFAVKMRKAEAEAEIALVKIATDGAIKDPSIAVKVLSRRFRENWGEVITHKNDWTFNAIISLKNGDVTWEDLKGTFNETQLEEIKVRLLESGEEGEWSEIIEPSQVEETVDATQSP